MTRVLTLLACLIIPYSVSADEQKDQDAIVGVIEQFFAAMTARDVDAMRSMMTADGMLYGFRETPDGLQISSRSHSEYLDGLAGGEAELVERFWEPEVVIAGRMATAWTPYDFYIDGAFSHCGVNSFSMLRTDEGWLITGVVYSIMSSDCAPSPLGPFPSRDGQ